MSLEQQPMSPARLAEIRRVLGTVLAERGEMPVVVNVLVDDLAEVVTELGVELDAEKERRRRAERERDEARQEVATYAKRIGIEREALVLTAEIALAAAMQRLFGPCDVHRSRAVSEWLAWDSCVVCAQGFAEQAIRERNVALQQAEQACLDVRRMRPVVRAALRYADARTEDEDMAWCRAFYDAVGDYREGQVGDEEQGQEGKQE